MGLRAVDCGVLPTPALALEAARRRSPAVMVTGSHIPFDRNGLKFYLPDGEISKRDEADIVAGLMPARPAPAAANPETETGAARRYAERYVDFFGEGCLSPLRVGVYQHSAAGRHLLSDVLRGLGAEVINLGRTDDFMPIDTEAVDEATAGAISDWIAQHRLDALVSTDGDGDRPLLADEAGTVLRGDILGILAARIIGADAVAAPITVNTALERTGWFQRVRRTRIGSPYVIEAMAAQAANGARCVVGFEANGGFLLGSAVDRPRGRLAALPTRDALLPICLIVSEAARRKVAVSSLLKSLPPRATASDRLPSIPPEDSEALLRTLSADRGETARFIATVAHSPIDRLDLADGIRVVLESGDIVHLRASGNAPELRCYCECAAPDEARRLVDRVLRHAKQTILDHGRHACSG
jgi:phosphomannomutase